MLHFYSRADHLQSHVVVASLFAANANDLQHIVPRFEVLVSLMSSKPGYGLCQYTCQVVAIIRPSAPIDPSLTLVGGGDH